MYKGRCPHWISQIVDKYNYSNISMGLRDPHIHMLKSKLSVLINNTSDNIFIDDIIMMYQPCENHSATQSDQPARTGNSWPGSRICLHSITPWLPKYIKEPGTVTMTSCYRA
jgi:hypothetical protein